MFEALSQPQPEVAEGSSDVQADPRTYSNADASCCPVQPSAMLAAQPAKQPEDAEHPASASPAQQRQEAAACSALSSSSSCTNHAEEPSHAAVSKGSEGRGLHAPLHDPLEAHGGLAAHAAEICTMTEGFLVQLRPCTCLMSI